MASEIVPPRYVTPAELAELQEAWIRDPRSWRYFTNGYKPEDLPAELQNIVVTQDGKAPPADAELCETPAGQGPLHYVDLH